MPGEDKDARTEAPTPRRRQEARNKGQVPKSQDLAAAVLLIGALVLLRILGPGIWEHLLSIFRRCLASDGATDSGTLGALAAASGREMCWMVLPFMALMALIAVAVSFAQVGALWTTKPLTPDLSKLNPMSGVKRLFSFRSVVMLGMNLGKLALIGGVVFLAMRSMADRIIYSMTLEHLTLFGLAAHLVFRLGMLLALLLLVLAIIDYAYQRYRHEKDLRMTKEEVKDELRNMEGDPVVKNRRRQVQMQLAMQRLRTDVPQADVVVTNPTHVAVALKYDADTMIAPKLIAKGADHMAIRIRQIAASAGVPILERPPLARGLFESVEIGQEVPEQFYKAVAEILAYVYELGGRQMAPTPAGVPL